MLRAIGEGAARRPWRFLAGWGVVLVLLVVASGKLSHQTQDDFKIPGTESQAAQDALTRDFPSFADASMSVVFNTTDGTLTSTANSAAVQKAVQDISKVSGVSSAVNPLQSPYDLVYLSKDKKIAYSTVTFDQPQATVASDAVAEVQKAAAGATDAGVHVNYSGGIVDTQDPVPPGISQYADTIGLIIAALILLICFGSVVSMGLPLGTALGALAISATGLTVIEHYATIGSINPIFGTMLGLGVGVDYALLVLNRYLQNRAAGEDVVEAAGGATATAGRAVLFAGATITMAVVALVVLGIPYLSTMGFTSAMYIIVAVLAALTLMPALIGLAGNHVESLRLPFLKPRSEIDPEDRTSFWGKWAGFVTRRWVLMVPVGLAILVVLAVPVRRAQLGFVDESSYPKSTTERQAYDLIAEGFGQGSNGPLVVAVTLPGSSSSDQASAQAAAKDVATAIGKTSGVQSTVGPITNSAGTAAVIEVIPSSAPSAEATQQLTKDLRDTVVPTAVKGTPLSTNDVLVGGETAVLIDLSARIASRLPLLIAVVLGAAFLLLMMLFRSLLVPLKAVILNLLMFVATYGLSIAVFEWGYARGLIGLSEKVPLESFVPVVVFAVLFGLSTDYEVFLVSRIREAYDATGDAREAVELGVTTTARVITSAALIMAAVFLSFVTNQSVLVKMIGLPLGMGILLDAFVVRLTIVPGLLKVMGDKAWYLPAWLDRILPSVSLEESARKNPDAEPQGDLTPTPEPAGVS